MQIADLKMHKTFHLRGANPPRPVCAMLPDKQLEDLRASLWRNTSEVAQRFLC